MPQVPDGRTRTRVRPDRTQTLSRLRRALGERRSALRPDAAVDSGDRGEALDRVPASIPPQWPAGDALGGGQPLLEGRTGELGVGTGKRHPGRVGLRVEWGVDLIDPERLAVVLDEQS